MSLAVCTFLAWITILILAMLPKTLTLLEMVFLFFVCTIFELSIFTIFHLNLHWIEVSTSPEKSFANLTIRLICVPVILVIISNVQFYPSNTLRWILLTTIVVLGVILQKIMQWLGIITTPHWNMWLTILMWCSYFAFARVMVWFIRYLKKTEDRVA
ncbi:hypothetical protein AN477_08495 [Alicyclobacillus ferrooxydans]|uniref:Uncharacterized protein n=1 Tax=Alicyclobacillus ferrooxydans TaxID=471514 RepID=A0A0P9CMC5_9BACL|nr:hypothetical protein AN477_08495 [Alicyclobacillus ferrooxydans]